MNTVLENDINLAFYRLCKESVSWPIEERRGGDKLYDSPHPVYVCIKDPRRRVLNIPFRNNSIVAQCAETLWVLAGRNDVEWLSKYLPRAKDFSDDGMTWRAGYGPRIREYGVNLRLDGHKRVDQLAFVVNELRELASSRRAVMTLFSPLEDIDQDNSIVVTKDFPCTQSISFMMRRGMLDLTGFIRSNDLVWGWSGVNVFEFTVLQELIANMINMPVGSFYFISNNLHVYERHWNLAKKISSEVSIQAIKNAYDGWVPPRYRPVESLNHMDVTLGDFFALEQAVASKDSEIDVSKYFHSGTLLDDLCNVALAYAARKSGRQPLADLCYEAIIDRALQNSYMRYIRWEASRAAPE